MYKAVYIYLNHHFFVVRPDVFNELLKYPEVFFIRDVPKLGDSAEVTQCYSL